MPENFAWYSFNTESKTEDHPPVELAKALEIARQRFENSEKKYDDELQAGVETTFGLRRDDKTYIEISVHNPRSIAYTFQTKTFLNPESSSVEKALDKGYRCELTLKSWQELEQRIREFYEEQPSEIRRRLAKQKATVTPGQIMIMGAFIVYMFVGAVVYGDKLNMACNMGNGCKIKHAIFIWPYYVFGPGAAK